MTRKLIIGIVTFIAGLHLAWYIAGRVQQGGTLPDARQAAEYQRSYLQRMRINADLAPLETAPLDANGYRLNLTVFPREKGAPVIVFVPGTSVYAGFYIEFMHAMYRRGFTVVGFDPRGHGMSSGRRGDYTIDGEVADTLAVARYARERFGVRPALAGSSQGGMVAFYAAAADDSIAGAVCHNIADLNGRDNLVLSRVRPPRFLVPLLEPLMRLYGGFAVPISFYLDLTRERMKDGTDVAAWSAGNPLVVRWITLRALASLLHTAPAKPVEDIAVPVMLIHSDRDNIFPQSYVEGIYNRLTWRKHYLLLRNRDHLVMSNNVEEVAPAVAAWLREIASSKSR